MPSRWITPFNALRTEVRGKGVVTRVEAGASGRSGRPFTCVICERKGRE